MTLETSWERPTARSLVKVLAVTPGHTLHRDQIIDRLWPDAPPDSALNSFRKALHWARHALEPELERGQASHFLHLHSEVLGFDRACVTVDVDEFEMSARAALRTGVVEDLAAALSAYGGELLPEDRYVDWAVERRAQLAELAVRLLLELAAALERKGLLREATDYLRQALQSDPTQEEIARRLMRLLVRSGNRHEALQQYRRTTDVLRSELGVEPEPETMELHAELLAGPSRATPSASRAVRPLLASVPAAALRHLTSSEFVGRERAAQLVADAAEAATQGLGGLVLISGEAGVGKTRFTAEAIRRTEHYGPLILWGAGYGLEGHFPYGPFVEALESYLGLLPPTERQRLAKSYPHLQLLLPSFQNPQSHQPTVHVPPAGQRDTRGTLFGEVVRLLDELGEQAPLVLVLDDLQGADVESLHLLHHLARLALERRWLVLANYREEDVPAGSGLQRLVTEITRANLCRRIRLLRLGREECNRLVQSFLPDGEVAPDLREHLYAISRGNPLFVREVVAALRERGELALDGGIWQWRGSGDVGVPEQVRELILARAARLSESTRRMLDMASVAGVEFTFSDIRAGTVIAGTPVDNAEGQVLDALDNALYAHLLEEDERGYTFSHPLVRASLYQQLTRHRRTYLHGVLACAIEQQRASDVETIAFHYERSTWHEKAVEYLERAGDRARRVYANEAAIGYFERALARLQETPDPNQMSRLREKRADALLMTGRYAEAQQEFADLCRIEADPARRIELLRQEGIAWQKQGKHDVALVTFAAALTEVERAGVDHVAAEVRVRLEIGHGQVLEEVGQYSEAAARAEHAIDLARCVKDERLLAQAHHLLARVYTRTGEYSEAQNISLRGLEIAEQIDDDVGVIACLSILGHTATLLGEPERGEAYHLRAVELAERMGDPSALAIGLNNLGVAAHARGEYRRAVEFYRRCVRIRETTGDLEGLAISWINLGEAALFGGDLAEAEHCCERSRTLYEATDDQYGLAYVSATLAGIEHARGNLKRADALYRESMEMRERIGDRPGVVDCWIGLGEVACDRGALREALRLHRNARRLARGRAPELEVRAALGSARAYLRLQRPRYAEPFLRHALTSAAEHEFGRLVVRATLAQCELAVCAGRMDEIGTVAQQAHSLAAAGDLRIEAALAMRWLGLGCWRTGDSTGADENLRTSLRLLQEIGAELEVARTAFVLAQLQLTDDPRDESRRREVDALLTRAQEIAREWGALPPELDRSLQFNARRGCP